MYGYKRFTAVSTVLGGLFALFASSADAAPKGDCARVASADQAVCLSVQKQHAYGWTDNQGTPQGWAPRGRVIVHDIVTQGLTQEEMGVHLRAEARSYRAYVTHVTFNMDAIERACGHKHGSGSVAYVTHQGKSYTFRLIACD